MLSRLISRFIQLESSGGILLFIAAVLALVVSNSPLNHWYQQFFSTPLGIHFGAYALEKPLLLWINDGLMVFFFFLVGLEIKREMVEGELNSVKKITMPGLVAVGGMVVPALVYVFFTHRHAPSLAGWAIPAATDLAFALAVLSLLGSRLPSSLKVFLTAFAIFDDIGAIVVIAIFYTAHVSVWLLLVSLVLTMLLFVFNYLGVVHRAPYFLVALVLWVCVLKSGVHATLVGILLAFAIPIKDPKNASYSPLKEIEHNLHPWVAFLVLPVFAFANAGVSFSGVSWANFLMPVPLGILCGLFVGKQLGIFGSTWLAVKLKLGELPEGSNWLSIYGLSLVAGIGFTMSLFIGGLAFGFSDATYGAYVRMGVIGGSLLSGALGYWVLRLSCRKRLASFNIVE